MSSSSIFSEADGKNRVHHGNTAIKKLSREARSRLKDGFWNRAKDEKYEALKNTTGDKARDIDEYFSRILKKRIAGNDAKSENSLFYSKVCEIIDNEENITNPLSMLTDDTVMEKLSFENRQKYLFDVSERYKRVRAEILEERQMLGKPIGGEKKER